MGKIDNMLSLEELYDSNAEELSPERIQSVLTSLQAQCVKREYCVSDIRKKALKAVQGQSSLADELVEALVRERFVDNLRYATAFSREKSSISAWGPSKIRNALLLKGIDRATIAQALKEIDEDAASERMMKALSRKWHSLKEDPYGKFKLIRFGLSRGYEYDAVSSCVEELLRGDNEASN